MDVKAAVVTGGHDYDVPGFHALFRAVDGVDAYIQNLEDFATSSEANRSGYDVIVFYNFHQATPPADGSGYKQRVHDVLEALGGAEQGIVVLHHAILAYPGWALWSEIVGIADRRFDYHDDQRVTSRIADADHPITCNLSDWQMIDETYKMADPGADSEVLLTTDHPKSMKTIAWTRPYRSSAAFAS